MTIQYSMPPAWASYKKDVPYGYSVISTKEALARPDILGAARNFINRSVSSGKPIGYKEFTTLNGKKVCFVVEPHYHAPNGPVKPWGWHKGCTVYVPSASESYWAFLYDDAPGFTGEVDYDRLKAGARKYAIPTAIGVGTALMFGPVAGALVSGGMAIAKYAIPKPKALPPIAPSPEVHAKAANFRA